MRDVAFYINRKTGPIKYRDSGLADIFLGGSGLTAHVHIAGAGRDTSSVFKVKDVTVKIDSLKFSVRDTKHDALIKMFKPLVTGLVKKQISKAVQDAIRTGLEYVDGQLVAVRDRYTEARQNPDLNTTETFKSLFEKKAADAQSKADSIKNSDSQFKVVTSKRDSLLPNEGHEGGWINKVEDREAVAHQGEGWKSPAFNIVPTASGSGGSGVPRALAGTGPSTGYAGGASGTGTGTGTGTGSNLRTDATALKNDASGLKSQQAQGPQTQGLNAPVQAAPRANP